MSDTPARIIPVRPNAVSVAEFNRNVKQTVEQHFGNVWIEGEIASCKIAASGHAYFDLKDEREDARISCVMFKGVMSRTRGAVRDGERVAIHARASLYAPRGQFQVMVEALVPAGAGSVAAALEALKKKLAAEGLFAPDRKRKLPVFPHAIGVVTSITGAAVADICRVAHRRWPARIIIANTLVQGAEAPLRIVAALQAIQRVRAVDVIILGRGGGASDDLSAFNDERVARAIAASRVPVISAVGHEVDHTLADLVADVRAATPSNAAEMAVPEWKLIRADLDARLQRLASGMRARLNARRVVLARLEKRMGDPRRVVDELRQRFDDALTRMSAVQRRSNALSRRRFDELHTRLKAAHPRTKLTVDRAKLEALSLRLEGAMRKILEVRTRALQDNAARLQSAAKRVVEVRSQRFANAVARLQALSPLAILARGYSIVLANKQAVRAASDVHVGQTVTVRLHAGELEATVTSTHESE